MYTYKKISFWYTLAMHAFFSPHKRNLFLGLIGVLIVSAGLFGYSAGKFMQRQVYANYLKGFGNIRENSNRYTFINPLIGGISRPATDVGIFSDIKDDIDSYFADEEKKGNLYDYSFYFRDLSTGFWFGANEGNDFFPASLFKLPVAIAIYKEAEEDSSFLKKYLVYTDEISKLNSSNKFNSESTLEIGKSYTVEQLVNIMLTASDNGAKNLLLSVLNPTYLDQLFSIVSLADPQSVKKYKISSIKYALFLRVLYNSSYLNEEHSEFLLSTLSKTTFKDGIIAGIPQSVVVAHKFGTYEFDQQDVNGNNIPGQQLHDCGIVYHQERPYIFCLMTSGKNVEVLYKIISHISKMIYDNQEKDDNTN
jgi:beta-lactamase class A